jgi:hypothetical protein
VHAVRGSRRLRGAERGLLGSGRVRVDRGHVRVGDLDRVGAPAPAESDLAMSRRCAVVGEVRVGVVGALLGGV